MAITDPIPEKYRSLVAGFLQTARGIAERGDALESIIFVGSTQTGEYVAVPMDASDEASKETAGTHARQVSATLNADYSLMVGEAWALPGKDLSRHEEILERYGSVGAYPGRLEVVIFVLETRQGFWSGQAALRFKTHSKKKRTFGEVTFIKVDEGQGRLANIIQKDANSTGQSVH